MVRSVIAWLWSDRGLLVIGSSLVLGGLGYLWTDCLRLWRVRRSMRDGVDLASTTVFTAMLGSLAVILRTYDSLPTAALGCAVAVLSYLALRRALRLTPRA